MIPSFHLTKVKGKKEVIDKARTSDAEVHFASLMDICHLKNAELEAKHQKYKSRVVLRGDTVKDDSVFYTVFTEQGSSVSQVTVVKIMDIISRLSNCDGQAADAVSVFSQVKTEDAHKLSKNPKSECPDIWTGLPRHKWLESWSSMEDPVVPLERNLYVHSLAGLLWERQFEKILLKHGWEIFPNWEYLFVHRRKRIILVCECGWHEIDWKETKIWSDVETSQKRSWLGKTNIFPASCILRMHSTTMPNKQRCCGQLQNHVWIENFCGGIGKITFSSKYSYFLMDLWHGWSCKEVCGTKLWVGEQDDSATVQSIYSMHRWPSLQKKKSVGELSQVCSQIVLKCLYLKCIGRPDILRSVNKLARSITK